MDVAIPILNVAIFVTSVIVMWIIISFPLYLASKLVVKQRSELVRALVASFLGIVAFILFAFIFGPIFPPLALIAGFIGTLLVMAGVYGIGLIKSLFLTIVAFLIFVLILGLLLLFGIAIPFFSVFLSFYLVHFLSI
jgi:hypothetical protein